MQWIDGQPCPTCGAAPKNWEYHYPRGDSDKDAEINRLRGVLSIVMNYFDAIEDVETANKIRTALALGEGK